MRRVGLLVLLVSITILEVVGFSVADKGPSESPQVQGVLLWPLHTSSRPDTVPLSDGPAAVPAPGELTTGDDETLVYDASSRGDLFSVQGGIPGYPGWRLVFHDEFDGPQFDETKWRMPDRWGRKNLPEIQYYAPDAFEFRDGVLRIRADERKMEGMSHTSGLISTLGRFELTYGYMEMRAKLPKGRGLWPAFWLVAVDKSSFGELDAMEFLGHESNRVWFTLHANGPRREMIVVNDTYTGPDFTLDYHIFGMEWGKSDVIWYVDGVERFRVTTNVPAEPMYLITNLAIGGEWAGNPDASTSFPAYFDIDYIRVYQTE